MPRYARAMSSPGRGSPRPGRPPSPAPRPVPYRPGTPRRPPTPGWRPRPPTPAQAARLARSGLSLARFTRFTPLGLGLGLLADYLLGFVPPPGLNPGRWELRVGPCTQACPPYCAGPYYNLATSYATCASNQAWVPVFSGTLPTESELAAASAYSWGYQRTVVPGLFRYQVIESWRKKTNPAVGPEILPPKPKPVLAPIASPWPVRAPLPIPFMVPNGPVAPPLANPPVRPPVRPAPDPWPTPTPAPIWRPSPQVGPIRLPRTDPGELPWVIDFPISPPIVRPRPSAPGNPQEPPSDRPQTGRPRAPQVTNRPMIRDLPQARPREKPPRREKERKVKPAVPGLASALRGVAEELLELGDIIEALHGALPAHLRAPRGATPVDQANAVWENLDELDMNDAFCNLINNAIEDEVWGRFGSAIGAPIGEALNSPLGGQTLFMSRRRPTPQLEETEHPAAVIVSALQICRDSPRAQEAARRGQKRRRSVNKRRERNRSSATRQDRWWEKKERQS